MAASCSTCCAGWRRRHKLPLRFIIGRHGRAWHDHPRLDRPPTMTGADPIRARKARERRVRFARLRLIFIAHPHDRFTDVSATADAELNYNPESWNPLWFQSQTNDRIAPALRRSYATRVLSGYSYASRRACASRTNCDTRPISRGSTRTVSRVLSIGRIPWPGVRPADG